MELSKKIVITGLVALGATVTGCAPKKSFNGAANTTTAPKAAEQVPETEDPVEEEPTENETIEEETTEVETGNVFKDCLASKSTAFIADLYELDKGTKSIENLTTLTPIKQICLKQLDIANREFTLGFPGVEGLFEWFGLNITTRIDIAEAGTYKFRLNSDDGSRLYIDGKQVIDNDGQHSVESVEGSVELSKGSHDIQVKYFQGPAKRIALELFWTPPGGSESYLPLDQLSRP